MGAADAAFYAIFEIKSDLEYTVETYTMGTDGIYVKTNTVKRSAYYGEVVDATPSEIATGFYLDGENSSLTDTVKKTDEVVLAVYLAREKYFVAIDGENADSDSKAGSYLYGMTVSEPVAPAVEEYQTFEGWYTTAEDGTEEKVSFPYTVEGNVTIYAKITTKEWRLDFATDGGSYVESIEGIPYGTTVTNIASTVADPTKEGYTFVCWTYLDEEGNEIDLDSTLTMPNSNLTLTAKWTKNS